MNSKCISVAMRYGVPISIAHQYWELSNYHFGTYLLLCELYSG